MNVGALVVLKEALRFAREIPCCCVPRDAYVEPATNLREGVPQSRKEFERVYAEDVTFLRRRSAARNRLSHHRS